MEHKVRYQAGLVQGIEQAQFLPDVQVMEVIPEFRSPNKTPRAEWRYITIYCDEILGELHLSSEFHREQVRTNVHYTREIIP